MRNKLPFVSILILCYYPPKEFSKVLKSVFAQKYPNFEILIMNNSPEVNLSKEFGIKRMKNLKVILNKKNLGIAGSLNNGIKKSKGEVIVTILQDTIPVGNNWLKPLISKMVEKNAVACTSLVEYPLELLKKSDPLVQPLIKNWVGTNIHGLDEKGSAYRKDALLKVKLFDFKNFKTAGEDFDMDRKLRMVGPVVNSKSKVIHNHIFDKKAYIHTFTLYGESFGMLFRKYGFSLNNSFGGVFRALPPLWAFKKIFEFFIKGELKPKHFSFLLKCNLKYSKKFWRSFIYFKQF